MAENREHQLLRELDAALDAEDARRLDAALEELHPAEVAAWFDGAEKSARARLVELADDERLGEVFEYMDPDDWRSVVLLLPDARLARVVADMARDDAADLLHELDEERARRVLDLVETSEQREIRDLFAYPPDTAGGRMATDVVAVQTGLTVREAIAQLRKQAPTDAETVYYAYVCDAENRLVGVLSLRRLLGSSDDQLVEDVMDSRVVAVEANTDQEEVAQLIERYSFLAVPVVDTEGRLLGIVTVDDAMAAAEQEATEDLFRKTGLSVGDTEMLRSERIVNATLPEVLRLRMPWLLVVLVGGLLAGGVIGQFEEMLQSVVALAVFIPVMMDMGGNVGTQSSTIFVRGMVLGHIDLDRRVVRYIARQAVIGLVMGAITGLGAGLVAWVWQGELLIGVVVMLSMTITCSLASVVGYSVPWLMHRLGVDPAAASDPFITTFKDITGLLIYFTLATTLLGHLM
jgi:magnesium transporter